LRLATTTIGPDVLGFSPSDIGLHSARSRAVMAMYLSGMPVFTILLLGRWSSKAFLCYIRKQVQEFSSGISTKMIQQESLLTISASSSTGYSNRPNNTQKPATRSINGHDFWDTICPFATVFQ